MKHSNFKTNVHNLVLAAMFLALALVLVVSLCDKAPGREVTDLFERAAKAR